MISHGKDIKVFTGNSNPALAKEICQIIGADSLGYLSCESAKKLADNSHGFCTACFDGKYPVEPPVGCTKNKYERKISEAEA